MLAVVRTASDGTLTSLELRSALATNVRLQEEEPEEGEASTTAETTEEEKAPSPLEIDPSELAWSVGAFLVLFLLIRFAAYPRLERGMEARAAKIRGDLETAEQVKAQALAARAEYDAAVQAARVEASQIIDEARSRAAGVRAEKIGALNQELNELRVQASVELDEGRRAAASHVESAVADVAIAAAQRVLGVPIDTSAGEAVVRDFLAEAGVTR